MIKRILHAMIRKFEREFGYDASYSHQIIDVSTSAGIRSFGLPMITQMKGPDTSLWAGAGLASVLDGECGPCAQLVVDQAIQSGVPSEFLVACLRRDFPNAGTVGLGFRFAEAVISSDLSTADALRSEIESNHGKEALIAASYATAGHRTYPILKRALGFGIACQMLQIGDIELATVRPTT